MFQIDDNVIAIFTFDSVFLFPVEVVVSWCLLLSCAAFAARESWRYLISVENGLVITSTMIQSTAVKRTSSV